MSEYDVIVIGAGSTGENVADRAAAGGLSVAIVESELAGGECSYWACMPSKALLRSAGALRAARRVGGARQAVTGELDVAAVLARRDKAASLWDDHKQVEWLDSAGVVLVRGTGTLTGEREVTVTTIVDTGSSGADSSKAGSSGADSSDSDVEVTVLTARHAVAVCTGSASLLPDIPGLRESEPWTSRDATSAQVVPGRLAIMGGGVVGVELATAYAGFGTEVTLFTRNGLLGNTEPFAGEIVKTGLEKLGATVHLGVEARTVSRNDTGVTIELDDGSAIAADELLVATGRSARTGGLGLDSVGLTDGDWIDVDDTLRVPGTDWLYAVGDVNHRALLTHQGKYQARAAGDVIAARAQGDPVDHTPWSPFVATADHCAVPQVVFSDPEVATVGHTESSAQNAGLTVRVVDYELGNVAGASLHASGYTGKARMIVDEKRKVVVGMTFVGQDVGEMIHAATIAIVGELPINRLWHAVPAYPTISEVWLRLLEEYGRL